MRRPRVLPVGRSSWRTGHRPVPTRTFLLSIAATVSVINPARADDFLDRLGDSLTFSSHDDSVRTRISGLCDLEGYYTPDTRSDLRFTADDFLFSPRLSLFLDTQFGSHGYLFAQTRIDRGFDPSDDSLETRLDELAFRWNILPDSGLNVQAGKFATVVGAWSARHRSWENPFVTAPLIFDNLTAMWDRSATRTVPQLLRRAHVEPPSDSAGVAADKDRRLPLIWGPVYASGAAVAGAVGHLEYAVEIKNAALSARPSSWDLDDRPWGDPTVGGRLGYRPNETWNFGVSGSGGTYLTSSAIPTVMPGTDADDHQQTLFGADIAYAHRHLQCWAEYYESRFGIPGIGDVTSRGYYIEAKYKFMPQLFGAVRWNQQSYSRVTTSDGRREPWGRNTWRIDFAVIHRLSAHTQVKLQYSPQHEEPAPKEFTHAVAMQFTARF